MIQKLKSLLFSKKIEDTIEKTFSFDIFDTLITRKYADPRDPLRVACQVTAQEFKLNWKELFHLRMFAEEKTRENSLKEDITFEEIYDALRINYPFWKEVWDKLQALEWEEELKSVEVVWENFHLFDKLKKEGKKLIFISDMYLRKQQIQDLLSKCGYDVQDVPIYVSSEIGLGKYTGNLYTYILQNLKNEKIHHLGDNYNSDIQKAVEKNVEATHFIETHLHESEKNLIQSIEWSKQESLFLGLLRKTRLEYFRDSLLSKDELKTISDFTTIILGPFLLSFVLWLKKQKKPNEKLYFIARDGRFLYEMYRELYPEEEVYYLHGSRQAWFLPCMDITNQADYDWLFLKDHPKDWKYFSKKLELSIELKTTIEQKFNIKEDTQLTQNELQDILLHNEIKPKIQLIIQKRRKRLLSYLHYMKVGDGESGFVDLGWTFKTLAKINHLLKLENLSSVRAYFVSCFYERVPSFIAGDVHVFLNPGIEFLHIPNAHLFWFKSRAVEQVLFAPAEHSTVDYLASENKVEPVFKNTDLSFKEIQTQILHTIKRFVKLLKSSGLYKELSSDGLKKGSFENLIHFLEGKYPYWLEIFKDYKLSIDSQSEEYESLLRYLKNE